MKTADDDNIPADLFEPMTVLDCRSSLSDEGFAFVLLNDIRLWALEARHQGRVASGEAMPLAEVIEHHSGARTYSVKCPYCLRTHQHAESEINKVVLADKCLSRDKFGRKLELPRGAVYAVVPPLPEDPSDYAA